VAIPTNAAFVDTKRPATSHCNVRASERTP
jgi:hypothetical protein